MKFFFIILIVFLQLISNVYCMYRTAMSQFEKLKSFLNLFLHNNFILGCDAKK